MKKTKAEAASNREAVRQFLLQGLSQAETARSVGLTRERVRQINDILGNIQARVLRRKRNEELANQFRSALNGQKICLVCREQIRVKSLWMCRDCSRPLNFITATRCNLKRWFKTKDFQALSQACSLIRRGGITPEEMAALFPAKAASNS